MNNLLESTQIGTVFLDRYLKIRKFTPAIRQHFDLINADIGRPLEHFTASMGESNLITRCKKVFLNATAEKDEEENIMSIRYTCVDISDIKRAEEQLKNQKADLERVNRDWSNSFLFVLTIYKSLFQQLNSVAMFCESYIQIN